MSNRNGKAQAPLKGSQLKGLKKKKYPASKFLRLGLPVLWVQETREASNDHRVNCRKMVRLLIT